MLNHLFATILICLGVANTTPISNYDQKESNLVLTTPKKSTITNNYEATITPTGTTQQTFYNVNVGYLYNSSEIEYKKNMNYNSNYINVVGNYYQTAPTAEVYWDDGPNGAGNYYFRVFQNWETIQNNTDQNKMYGAKECYVLKITPYNFNINTETATSVRFSITSQWANQYGDTIRADKKYVIRNVYTATENEWDTFIGRQLTSYTTYRIIDEIEDINNGFFYTKTQEIIDMSNSFNYTDEWDQEIPNQEFYLVIEYIYCIKASYLDNGNIWVDYGTNTETIPFYTNSSSTNGVTIRGTNIIPDGTYEVVDIPGLMYEVIGMPFAFVSQAFNLTLFPGTPYQINIANLFLSIIAIFVFVWLIMLFIKKGG